MENKRLILSGCEIEVVKKENGFYELEFWKDGEKLALSEDFNPRKPMKLPISQSTILIPFTSVDEDIDAAGLTFSRNNYENSILSYFEKLEGCDIEYEIQG